MSALTATPSESLDSRERAMVEHLAAGRNLTTSAREAGYAVPDVTGLQVLDRPDVRRALRAGLERRAFGIAGRALTYFQAVVYGQEEPNKGRIEVCKLVLGLCGLPAAQQEADKKEKSPHEQSRDELLAVLERAEAAKRELASRAVPILDNAPNTPGDDAQAFDIYG